MYRFYCPAMHVQAAADHAAGRPILSDQTIALDPDEAHHAARVLRIAPGEVVELFDGQGFSAQGVVGHVHKTHVSVTVRAGRHEPPACPAVWVAAAVAKGGRPEDMIDQLAQVGAAGWLPMVTARSVADPRRSRLDKLRKTAIAAAKQSGRAILLDIAEPVTLDDALRRPTDVRLWATSQSQAEVDDVALPARLAGARSVMVYIGPEGGWTDQEESAARDAGCGFWSLGPTILRIETAAVVAAALAGHLARFGQAAGRLTP